uniref:Uncharacterized protein n=1 Tax=Brassica oleracea var. oleracea TaxID=109376 RepID=A0A0D3DRT4_BRAOL
SLNRRPGVRHSTFESLHLVNSTHSIASGFLRFWDSLNFKKDREFLGITVLFLDEKVNFVIHGFTPVGCANHYMPSLKAGSNVKVDRFEVASKNRGDTGGNTPLLSPITDQNQLRSTKQKLAVVKKMPKLENEYGDHYTRPPDPMQHENQVIMSNGQGVLREIIDILLGSHKELVRPPDQSSRFLLVFRDLMLSLYPGEHRTHAETAMVEACLWSKWRKSFAAAAGYELNGKESFVCYIIRHVRGLEMIEQGSKSSLKHGKGLQSWGFVLR